MKDRSDRSRTFMLSSEVLTGKHPGADARLIRDIFRSGDTPTAASRKHHGLHIETKSTQRQEVAKWD